MEDFRRFIQKRNIGTADGKKNEKLLESNKMLQNYSGIDSTLARPPFFQSFQNLEDNDDVYDSMGQRRIEQTLYYEEEDFDHSQLPNLDEMGEHTDYMSAAARGQTESSIADLTTVDDEKIDQLRKRVRRDGAVFTRVSDDFDIKPLTRFMLPEEMVRENDVAWDWDSLISDVMIHPDVVELSADSDKGDNEDDSLAGSKLRTTQG